LVVIYCFSFCLSWKTFIAPSILNDSFAIIQRVSEYPRVEVIFIQCPEYLTPCSSCFLCFCWEICCYFYGFTFVCYLIFLSYSLNILSLICCLLY
jgi:hypothetical protein